MATTTKYNPNDEYAQAKKYAQELNKSVDIAAAPTITAYNQQIMDLPQQFNPYRNAAEVQSRLDAQTLAENMANMGLTRSGTNITQQTALATQKQNTLGQITRAETDARKDLVSQLNAYIAQRDAAKQSNLATAQQQAYQSVTAYKQNVSLAEINDQYYKQNAKLQREFDAAQADKNFARTAKLQKEMAELAREHDIKIANLTFEQNKKLTQIRANDSAASSEASAFAAQQKQINTFATAFGSDLKTKLNPNSENPIITSQALSEISLGVGGYGGDATANALKGAGLTKVAMNPVAVSLIMDGGSNTETSPLSGQFVYTYGRYLDGNISKSEALAEMQYDSRAFSKNDTEYKVYYGIAQNLLK